MNCRSLIYIIALILLAACVPVRESLYKPFGPGSRYSNACGSPANSMGFKFSDGLGVIVSAWKYDVERLSSIWVEYYISEGHVAKLFSPNVTIVTEHDGQTHEYKIQQLSREETLRDHRPALRQQYDYLPTEELKGATENHQIFLGFHNYRRYLAKIDTSGLPTKGKRFRLHLPAVVFDGKTFDIPEIQFEYRDEYHFVALMC